MRIITILVVLSFTAFVSAAETGQQIYAKQCASCHGKNGEGTAKFKRSLAGDKSIKQLAKYVQETMPEDSPGSLNAIDAEAVSAYMHETFYSPIARERNRPARVELSRMTVRQYQNSVADLVQSFRWANKFGDKFGLKGDYFKGRAPGQNKAFERMDANVNFDFGTASPDMEKIPDATQFAMQWSGGILAPETGTYEFIVRTEHATQLFVNDNKKAIIDAWVKSGNDKEYKATMYLIGGRVYPIQLRFTKSKQGVDDSKKNPTKTSTQASIRLWWKTPTSVPEPVPSRLLSPMAYPEQYIPATPFPPDDRSLGWERGNTVSKEWDAATTEGALELAAYTAMRINELAKTNDNAGDRETKIKSFCLAFTERAYRRPLDADQKKLVEKQFDGAKDLTVPIKKVVLMAVKSPRFLYREYGVTGDAYDVATRLSFALWDTIPDQPLIDAATKGQLTTREQLQTQATRMMADAKAKPKVMSFYHHWLLVEHAGELNKDTKRFPGFDPNVVTDLRTSLDLFLEDVTWGSNPDFHRLLKSDEIYVNDRMAKIYDVKGDVKSDFTKVKLDAGQRAGVLTHPFLLASFAYTGESSPIHRGVFLTRGVLGLSLRPPPEAVPPVPANLHPTLSTRERVIMQTKGQNCMTCHSVINDLGFTLEHFDAIGKFREKDNNKPINSTGQYLTKEGKIVPLKGAVDLANYLADSPEVHSAFAEQVFHHVAQQPLRAYGPQTKDNLTATFTKGNYNVRNLFIESAVITAMGPPKK